MLRRVECEEEERFLRSRLDRRRIDGLRGCLLYTSQRREGHESRARLGGQRQHARRFGFAVEEVVSVLEQQARHVALGQITERETFRFERIAR